MHKGFGPCFAKQGGLNFICSTGGCGTGTGGRAGSRREKPPNLPVHIPETQVNTHVYKHNGDHSPGNQL